MWEFPSVLLQPDEIIPDTNNNQSLKARLREFLVTVCPSLMELCSAEEQSLPHIKCKFVGQLEHIFTHIKMTYIAESLVWTLSSDDLVDRVKEGTFIPAPSMAKVSLKGKKKPRFVMIQGLDTTIC
jgi:hypothetical protein